MSKWKLICSDCGFAIHPDERIWRTGLHITHAQGRCASLLKADNERLRGLMDELWNHPGDTYVRAVIRRVIGDRMPAVQPALTPQVKTIPQEP